MDGFYSSSTSHNPRNLKPKGLNRSSSIPQIDSALIKYLCSGSPTASGGDAITSPLSKYQYGSGAISSRGGSPLSSVDNMDRSPVFGTPLKVEEDVLVMDGILLGSVPGGRITARSGSDSGSCGSSGKSTYKKEICRAWEDSSHCRFGSKCQFAHGKEELRPSRFFNKSKPEVHMQKSICSITGSSTSSGSKSRPPKQGMSSPTATPEALTGASTPEALNGAATVQTPSPTTKLEFQDSNTITKNWSPYDDGIEIGVPDASTTDTKPPSREEFDARIDSVLHGPTTKKRLPVFVDICPE